MPPGCIGCFVKYSKFISYHVRFQQKTGQVYYSNVYNNIKTANSEYHEDSCMGIEQELNKCACDSTFES